MRVSVMSRMGHNYCALYTPPQVGVAVWRSIVLSVSICCPRAYRWNSDLHYFLVLPTAYDRDLVRHRDKVGTSGFIDDVHNRLHVGM